MANQLEALSHVQSTFIVLKVARYLPYAEVQEYLTLLKIPQDLQIKVKKEIYCSRLRVQRGEKRIEYLVDGLHHCESGPAVLHSNGTKEWHKHGKPHRIGGPAIETVRGSKYWYVDGVLHNPDGPAEIDSAGTRFWYIRGKRHRIGNPAVVFKNHTAEYWVNGVLHSKVCGYSE